MSIRQETSERGRMIRQVEVSDQLEFVIDSTIHPWTNIAVTLPDIEVAGSEESPRFSPSYIIGWAIGYKGFVDQPKPGARIETAQYGVMELLSPPRQLKEHNHEAGWTALCNTLSNLYPVEGEWQEQGGATLGPIILSMYDEDEEQATNTRYENMDAECPVEYDIKVNQQVVVGGRIWKVTETIKNYQGPRIQMSLKASTRG